VLVVDSLAVGMPFLEQGLADAVVTCDGSSSTAVGFSAGSAQ
jgi:hypothetical protein